MDDQSLMVLLVFRVTVLLIVDVYLILDAFFTLWWELANHFAHRVALGNSWLRDACVVAAL